MPNLTDANGPRVSAKNQRFVPLALSPTTDGIGLSVTVPFNALTIGLPAGAVANDMLSASIGVRPLTI